MKKVLIAVSIAFIIISCKKSRDKDTIEVVGHASIKVVPDMVDISLTAYHVKPAMKDAVVATQQSVQQILLVCRKYVRDSSDIKVSSISTNKAYDFSGSHDRFIGYDASQVLEVSLKDISRIEQFTEELLATEISRIENIRYNHTRADSIMREVSLLALDDARQTAEKMCGKMHTTLGKVSHLSNFDPAWKSRGPHNRNGSMDYDMNLYNKGFGGRGFKMTAEILEFEDAAFASFDLK